MYLGDNPETGTDVALALVEAGLAKVRDNCKEEALLEAQTRAETAKLGIWAEDAGTKVRKITWEVENPRQLVDKYAGKPVKAVVEHVRDGTTIRCILLPDFIQERNLEHLNKSLKSNCRCKLPEGRKFLSKNDKDKTKSFNLH